MDGSAHPADRSSIVAVRFGSSSPIPHTAATCALPPSQPPRRTLLNTATIPSPYHCRCGGDEEVTPQICMVGSGPETRLDTTAATLLPLPLDSCNSIYDTHYVGVFQARRSRKQGEEGAWSGEMEQYFLQAASTYYTERHTSLFKILREMEQ